MLALQETRSIHDKPILYLIFNQINSFVGKTEKRNSQCEYRQPKLVLHMRLRCGSLSITTPVSHLANEFDVQSESHNQVSLAAVIKFCVIHEAMSGCKNLEINLRLALKI